MSKELDPYAAAAADARQVWTRWRYRLIDFGMRHLTAALVSSLLGSAGAVALGFIGLPVAAAVACTVVIVALCVHAVYSTRLLKRKDWQLRTAWVDNLRVRQRHLEHQIATDNVILELMGEPPQRHKPFRSVPPDLRSALAYVKRRQREAEVLAEAAGGEKDGAATGVQRRAPLNRRRRGRDLPAPRGPDIGPIKRRRDARIAESNTLEAEIQALMLPGDVERAMALANAKRTQRECQDAAMKAAQAARERARAGLPPTAEEPEGGFTLGRKLNGDRDVRSSRRPATPEQIARGETGGPVGSD